MFVFCTFFVDVLVQITAEVAELGCSAAQQETKHEHPVMEVTRFLLEFPSSLMPGGAVCRFCGWLCLTCSHRLAVLVTGSLGIHQLLSPWQILQIFLDSKEPCSTL